MNFKILFAIVTLNCLFGLFWKKSVQNGGNVTTFLAILGITYLIGALMIHVFGIEFSKHSANAMNGSAKIQMVLSAVSAMLLYVFLSNLWATQDISRLMVLVSMGSIVGFSLVGLIVFQEKFSWDKIIGLILAVVSLFFLNFRQIVKN